MPGCADCIDELKDNGYTEKQAVFMSQFPPDLIQVVGHAYLCYRHIRNRYIRKREEKLPTMGPKEPSEGVAR